jgi:hypothetical protein
MEITLARALVAAARAFADELERGLPADSLSPAKGSAQSMHEVLRSVATINESQARGASDEEIRVIARRAGMDPRGMAGYYAASLLEKRSDGTRWVSLAGRERLLALTRVAILTPPMPGQPASEKTRAE